MIYVKNSLIKEAPQREIARQKKESDEALAALKKAKTENRAVFQAMTIIIVLSLGAAGSLVWLSRWFHREEEMGSVSAQWLFEYRQNEES